MHNRNQLYLRLNFYLYTETPPNKVLTFDVVILIKINCSSHREFNHNKIKTIVTLMYALLFRIHHVHIG